MTVAYLRSHSYENDGRLARYLKICKDENIDFMVFDWERTGRSDTIVDCDWRKPFNYKAKTGSGLKNLFGLFLFNLYLVWQLIKLRNEYNFVHAADLDTLIPALIVSKIFNKPFAFDIYDKYSASRKMPCFMSKVFDWIEFKGIEIADYVIIPHICRLEQFKIKQLKLKNEIKIFENIPLMAGLGAEKKNEIDLNVKEWMSFMREFKICLVYVGILEAKHRGLENLIKAVSSTPNIGLLVAGSGELSDYMQKASVNHKNIFYVGRVSPINAHDILNQASIHVGFYYTTIPNHLYAAPNKYYEHLFYGKPMLTNEGIPPASLVVKYDTGYVIEQSLQSMLDFLNNINVDELKAKSIRARKIWDDKYANYHSLFSSNYKKMIV